MFWLNLLAWRCDPYISGRVDSTALGALDAGLRSLVNADDRNRIRWRLRQLVFTRKASCG